ncbi:hypothetical protein KAU04_04955 [bacterium]|nr:hypothetical protein [bacterium]MCK4597363.1 hypothetical protein [bacterium]
MVVRPLRMAILALALVFAFALTSWADVDVNPWSKMGGVLQVQLNAKMRHLEDPASRRLEMMSRSRMGVDASNPHRQKVFLHFESYPTGSQLAELRDLDVPELSPPIL